MESPQKILSNRSLGSRGQVAIFIALIFQVLFLFFAMVVNVGLLVHHKINLQNSVDLAAYYGAMKQAEMMNAIGHINYQIRQSYKLLTWRYRVLGTAGVFPTAPLGEWAANAHPNNKGDGADTGQRGSSIIQGQDYEGINEAHRDFYNAPSFCVAFRPLREIPPRESTCQSPIGQRIAELRRPAIIAGFIGAAHTALRVTEAAIQAQMARCEYAGPFNYVMLARFIVAYNIDHGDRKILIYKLANGLSDSTEDFLDLEGERASEGIRKTLENNLTAANRESLTNFKIYNSLAHDRCRQITGGGARPPQWLSDIWVYPRASYKMCTYTAGGGSQFAPANIDQPPDSLAPASTIPSELMPSIQYLKSFVAPANDGNPYRPSLGLEKNPWCMAYTGVAAETKPQIPFSVGTITLKAVAFAKPFGGRIGPWYGKTWSPGSNESTGSGPGGRLDPLTPSRCVGGNFENCTVSGQDAATTVNYSRFPSDRFGMMSRNVHAQYTKSIFDLGTVSFNSWEGIEMPAWQRQGGEWDPLINDNEDSARRMRDLEVSSVAPDIFDLTYYSIDPEFHKNYFAGKLEKYIERHPIGTGQGQFRMRHDIGARGHTQRASFSIRDQLRTVANLGLTGASNNSYGLDLNGKLFYQLSGEENFARVLTGWVPTPDLTDYSLDRNRFGRCTKGTDDISPAPGSCVTGGRSGYSVKLVSSDFLYDSHSLGGEGSPTEKILNPPPQDFFPK